MASIGTDLTQGSVGKQLLKFSFPFMLANMLQSVYSMVDTIVVGQFVGADGLSAVSTCGELIMLYTFIAVGFGGAGQTMIGQSLGSGRRDQLNRIIGTMFSVILPLGIVCAVIVFLTVKWQLALLNLPEEAYQSGLNYTLICAAGFVFIYGYNLVSSIMRGMGDSKRPLLFVGIASIMNLILDLVFVAGFGMGAAGAALATVMGQGFSFFCALVYLYRHRDLLGFDFQPKSFVPDLGIAKSIVKLGIPMAAQGALIGVSMLYVCSLVNEFGVAASAANGITLKLNSITRIVTMAMSTSSAAMTAQCIGARDFGRCQKVFAWAMVIDLVFTVLWGLAMLFAPQQIFSIFTSDAGVLAYATVYSVYGCLDYIAAGIRAPFMGLVNGTGAAGLGLAASIVDGVVARIGFSILFGNVLGMGVAGYWLGNLIASNMTTIVVLPYYVSGRWKKKKLLV